MPSIRHDGLEITITAKGGDLHGAIHHAQNVIDLMRRDLNQTGSYIAEKYESAGFGRASAVIALIPAKSETAQAISKLLP